MTRPGKPVAVSVSEVAVGDARLDRMRAAARLLDSRFRIPGTNIRFGLDAIVGLVPGVGDFAGAIASAYFIYEAARLGAPGPVLARMVTNVGVEALVGAIPILGDLFDVAFKANNRNVRLLEQHAVAPDMARRSSRKLLVGLGIGLVLLVVVTGALAVMVGLKLFELISSGRGPL
jgi:hypothetical protein